MKLSERKVGALVFLASFAGYCFTLLPDIGFWDGPYLLRMAHELDLGFGPNQHPLYLLTLKAFLFQPFGDLAVRGNLHSGLWAALAVMQLYFLLRLLSLRRFWAAIGAAVWATSQSFWWCATEAEVYTMTVYVMVVLLSCVVSATTSADFRMMYLAALVAGLGIAVHPLLVLCVPGIIGYLLATGYWKRFTLAQTLKIIGFGVVGLAPLATLFGLAAGSGTFTEAAAHLRGASFKQFLSGWVPLSETPALLAQYLLLVIGQLGALPLMLVIPGLAALRKSKATGVLLSLLFLANLAFVINYKVEDRVYFYIPSFLVLAITIAFGYQTLADKLARYRLLARSVTVLSVVLVLLRPQQFRSYIQILEKLAKSPATQDLVQFIPHTPGRDDVRYTILPMKQGIRPARYYYDLLLLVPSGSIIVDDWLHGFPIMADYYQRMLDLRPDVQVVRWRYFLDTEPQKQQFVQSIASQIPTSRVYLTTAEFPMADFVNRLQTLLKVGLGTERYGIVLSAAE